MSLVTRANPQLGWGHDWTRNTTPEIPIFPNEINTLTDFRGGVELRAILQTGDAMSGREAAEWGFATRSFPVEELEQRTLDFAERAAKVPVELQQLNKRSVHRAMEIMGVRAAIRAGTEIQALAFTTEASRAYMSTFRRDGGSVKQQLDERDTTFGDYRTRKP
jgi:enoyl-CoA hydratase